MMNTTFNINKKEAEKYLKVKPEFFNIEQLRDWVTDIVALNLQKIKFPESGITVNITELYLNQNQIDVTREEAEKYLEIRPNFFSVEQLKDWITDSIVLVLQKVKFPESEITVNIIE
ncbi:hypothetical protein [Xenorhabdus griffiniae]|uniref:Uncharacterized protein n=1 Tax=Xenorhabdus griffiniae TaxID=351672 RepID=A0ABY9XEU6_9GAMM|nr:hypothetical protein [Xenorhabdus griffiniae]MBD1225991.1 hypothetical protein [Xenorhabdus griffiniae]MBE8585891.1 hypothetical protein [Xenorhabdus griffiniae]WMV71435.1 hypothetical protein QL128_14840 [Xenorhabdus griffiniae]WNH01112.1 hypothetical protein QL112_014845 [Xenorhabdus griffiniae]